MGLNKRLIDQAGSAGGGLGEATDNFDIITYTGNGISGLNTANGADSSITLNANTASYGLASVEKNTGKWYWEVEYVNEGGGSPTLMVGTINSAFNESWTNANTKMYYAGNGQKYTGGSGATYGATFASGDIISVLYDGDNRTLTFWKNGVSQGTAFTGLRTDWAWNRPAVGTGSYQETASMIFDSNDFTYTMPSGYSALPSSTYMSVSGGSVASGVTANPINFQPDFVWIKGRTNSAYQNVYDSIRGAGFVISPNSNGIQNTSYDATRLTAFNSDGVTLGNGNGVNQSGIDYVAWCWKGGGAASLNENGSINSQVSANTAAGFSVVKYDGNSTSGATIGHGLNSAPEMILIKSYTTSTDWIWGHSQLGSAGGFANNRFWKLNTADLYTTNAAAWAGTNPTNSVFTVGSGSSVNLSGNSFVAYCWHSVSGYSKVGKYVGNGTTNAVTGLGFEPRYTIIRRISAGDQTPVHDAARDTTDPRTAMILVNGAGTEFDSSNYGINFDADGFTLQANYSALNASGSEYGYLAIA